MVSGSPGANYDRTKLISRFLGARRNVDDCLQTAIHVEDSDASHVLCIQKSNALEIH